MNTAARLTTNNQIIWAHKRSLTRHLLWKCKYQARIVCGRVLRSIGFSTIFQLDFGSVLTVWYRFCFSFY